jgi:CO/xanthine dehydrogenase FAD-binding subunit
MKPPAFDYAICETVEEAADLLHQHGDDARVIAGGQS